MSENLEYVGGVDSPRDTSLRLCMAVCRSARPVVVGPESLRQESPAGTSKHELDTLDVSGDSQS
jgi:hypothetical protein